MNEWMNGLKVVGENLEERLRLWEGYESSGGLSTESGRRWNVSFMS